MKEGVQKSSKLLDNLCNSLLHHWLDRISRGYKKAEPQGHNSRGAIVRPGGCETSIEVFAGLSQFRTDILLAKICNTAVTPFTKSGVKPCGAQRSRRVSFGIRQNFVTRNLSQRRRRMQRFFTPLHCVQNDMIHLLPDSALSQFEIKRSKKSIPRGHNSRGDIGRSGVYKSSIKRFRGFVK